MFGFSKRSLKYFHGIDELYSVSNISLNEIYSKILSDEIKYLIELNILGEISLNKIYFTINSDEFEFYFIESISKHLSKIS